MVGNVGLCPAKTFKRRRVTEDLRNGGPLEMPTIAKRIKIKVLLHQFFSSIFILHHMRLLSLISQQKYTNEFHTLIIINHLADN